MTFEGVAEAAAEGGLAEAFVKDVVGELADGAEVGGGQGAEAADGFDRGGDVTVGDLPADGVGIHQVRHVRGTGTEEEDGAGDGHGAVNLAGVNDANHFGAK